MRKILIIGIGAGNPDHMTIQAIEALNRADVVFIPDKGEEKQDLRRLRRHICERFSRRGDARLVEFEALRRRTDAGSYREGVAEWHGRIAEQYADLLRRELDEDGTGAFLVWGDPGLYDSTLRIVEMVAARGDPALDHEVIPGITSVQALAAEHRIPLNRIGEAVHITTGRQLADGFPDALDTVVVMLDGEQRFAQLRREDLDVFWGAYLGTADQLLVAGRLSEVADDIARIRAEARRAKGWIMDTYMLRRSAPRKSMPGTSDG